MVAHRESAALAEVLIRQTCAKQGIGRYQLTIHADRGSSMTSKPVAFLLADLGVTQSHSRPHVSDDNPFSEPDVLVLQDKAFATPGADFTFILRRGELHDWAVVTIFPETRAVLPDIYQQLGIGSEALLGPA